MFRELCGDTTLKNVVLVTNMWNEVSHEVGWARQNELSSNFFKPALDKGAQMVRHHNTTQSAHNIIRKIMANRPVALQIQRELVDEDKDIVDTMAGAAINRELDKQAKQHRDELEKVRKAIIRALERKDEETRKELEEETGKLQRQIEKIEKDSKEMASNYAMEKKRTEDKMKEMEEETKKGKQRAKADRDKMEEMEKELKKQRERAEADRARLEQEINKLKDCVTIPIYK